MINQYLRSNTFKKYVPDWISVGVLLIVFFYIVEPAKPFFRQFKLSDPTLQHPFATVERVSDNQLYFWSAIVPSIVIIAVHISRKNSIHILNLSLLGLWTSLSVNGVITDILKNLIGRPRPDFIARCGANSNVPLDQYIDISYCSSPLGQVYLLDGMKSTPSGHSLISFSGLLFLSLWLGSQFQCKPIVGNIITCSPILLAFYIALSRTQDYRHHFLDIVMGGSIGIVIASISFIRYIHQKRQLQ